MKHGQLTGKRNLDTIICRCFDHVSKESQRKFVKKFRAQSHDSDQVLHTLRELVLGAYLNSIGLRAQHDYVVDGKTPDWCILDDVSTVIGIVELVNFHIDRTTETMIKEKAKTRLAVGFWRNGNKDNVGRLYDSIWNKARAYQDLAKKLEIPYVVSVIGESEACIDFDEVQSCLHDEDTGLFNMYPEMSGVLYIEGGYPYVFKYEGNPDALWAIHLPAGVFPAKEAGHMAEGSP